MRLIERCADGELRLTGEIFGKIPSYAILSHTWGDGEVTHQDIVNRTNLNGLGFEKIRFCADKAWSDGLRYCWVDTCCIDKSSSNELSEAINSMYRWYRDAARCYVHLADVIALNRRRTTWVPNFIKSRWHTRGWTLQELLAPTSVEFFSGDGFSLGDRQSLEHEIRLATGLPLEALQGRDMARFSVAERLSWIERRETKREEDMAYALLGLFDVHMPAIYGERRGSAFRRLQEEIGKKHNVSPVSTSCGTQTPLWKIEPAIHAPRINRLPGFLVALITLAVPCFAILTALMVPGLAPSLDPRLWRKAVPVPSAEVPWQSAIHNMLSPDTDAYTKYLTFDALQAKYVCTQSRIDQFMDQLTDEIVHGQGVFLLHFLASASPNKTGDVPAVYLLDYALKVTSSPDPVLPLTDEFGETENVTPLVLACQRNDVATVRILLKAGANATRSISRTHKSLVPYLVEHTADGSVSDCFKLLLPLVPILDEYVVAASILGKEEYLGLLRQHSKTVHREGHVPYSMAHAIIKDEPSALRAFLKVGQHQSQWNEALVLASEFCRPSMIRALLASGADVNTCTAGTKNSALHEAFAHDCREGAEALLQAGADTQAVDDAGLTPLHTAIAHDNVGLVSWALESGQHEINPLTGSGRKIRGYIDTVGSDAMRELLADAIRRNSEAYTAS